MHGQGLKGVALFIILLLFLCWVFPGIPQTVRSYAYQLFEKAAQLCLQYQTRDYETLKSENFVLKYTKRDKDIAPFALQTAEEFYHSINLILDNRKKGTDLLVVLYPDQESLNRSFGWGGDKSAEGVYWAGSIRLVSPYAWSNIRGDSLAEIKREFLSYAPLSHELTHLAVDRMTGGNYTRWLTEGLAQHIEEEMVGFRLPEPTEEEKKDLYPLRVLESRYDSLENQVLVYWQSFETVQYLIEEHGMGKMRELLGVLGQGFKIEKALEKGYGISLEGLEELVVRKILPE